jgi:hypothetical protein
VRFAPSANAPREEIDAHERAIMKLRQAPIAGLIILLILVVFGILRKKDLDRGFEKVSTGMSRQEVIAIMGITKRTMRCDEPIFKANDLKKCAKIYVYPVSFAPLDPEYYVIYLDANKRVIDKFEYQSP